METNDLPPLNALRAFEAAARRGTFVNAAADLHVTHWAVGKQVRLLEDWLGVPLFERHARGVVLTDQGAELLQDVSAAFSRLGEAAAKLRQPRVIANRVTGLVRVNVLSSFALRWLLPRLANFQEQYPHIDVHLSTASRKLRYIGNAFDVGVRSGREQAAGVRSEMLMTDRRLPACSPNILRGRPIATAHDLRRHTLLHSSTTRTAWSRWLSLAGVPGLSARRNLEFDHVHLQLEAAVDGLGVALASLPLIEADLAAGRLVCPIAAPEWRTSDYELVINEDRAEDAAVRAFREWIMAAAGGSRKPANAGELERR